MILCSQERIDHFKAAGLWGETTIYEFFASNATATPDNLALADAPNKAQLIGLSPLRYTYRELYEIVDQLAIEFIKLDIKKDDIVVVQLPNVTEMVIIYLALNRIGAIVSPVAVQNRAFENKNVFRILEPKAYISTNNFNGFDFIAMTRAFVDEFPTVKTMIGLGNDLPYDVVDLSRLLKSSNDKAILDDYLAKTPITADDVFTICFTSGTEAEPKGVPRSSNEWLGIGSYCHQGCAVYPGYNILNPFPLINMSSIGGMWLPWLLSGGGAFVVHHPFDLNVMLNQIQEEKINYTLIPPAVLNMLLQNEQILATFDISSLKSIGSGSAPLAPWMVQGYQEKYGIKVYNVFGSTEGISFISNFEDPADRAVYFPRWGVSGYSWKMPMPQIISSKIVPSSLSSKIVDTATKETITEPGVPGEMCVSGPNVFCGYYKRPDLTEKVLDADGYFNTGDLFSIEGEGDNLNRYLFHGRSKDLIIRGGFNISPEEIENIVIGHPKVAEVAAIGYPDERLGEKVCVCAVCRPGTEPLTLEEIVEFVNEKGLAIYKRPEHLIVLDALPRNAVGKVVKGELRKILK